MAPGRAPVHLYTDNGLPSGYRFHPTAFEVLQCYLVPKLKGEALPSEYIRDLNVFEFDPQHLPRNESMYERGEEVYFFVAELLRGNDGLTRPTPKGCWKVYEDNVEVYDRGGAVIGHKKKLEFYNEDEKTDWKMVEYRTNFQGYGHVESCMVCRIKFKPKADEIDEEEDEDDNESRDDESLSDGEQR